MAFNWKEHNSIWKGEGIYFLTFVVSGRRKVLGTLKPAATSRWYVENIQRHSRQYTENVDGCHSRQYTENVGCHSRQYTENVERFSDSNGKGNATTTPSAGIAPSGGIATTSAGIATNGAGIAPNAASAAALAAAALATTTPAPALATSALAVCELTPFGYAVSRELRNLPNRIEGLKVCAKQLMPDHIHVVVWVTQENGRTIRQIGNGMRIGIKRAAIEQGIWNETDGHILDIPYIRTLAHKGQLRSMIDYVHANPDNAWMRHQNPALYVIQRDIQLAGLCFDGMGKDRLLAYPDRQVIALSRSLTAEQINKEVARALSHAERGAVTYTAAINEGEKAVARAIRTAGKPLVVMMLEGFPAQGTEAARYFHPDGVYHQACGEGRLMLLAPKAGNYQHPTLIALTEQELAQKAQAKGMHYSPLPHNTKRWRMIAGNVMLRMIAEAARCKEKR